MAKRFLCVAGLLLAGCALSGCIALGIGAAAAAGGVEYAEGRAVVVLDAPIDRVYNASLAELESEKLPIKHKQIDPVNADINAEYPGGDEIRIDIEALGADSARLKVRVGLTGNKHQESELLDAIKHRVS